GISLAVAVIPEGLPAIVTVALSIGVQRMMKRRVIVRKLAAVETLGCATIICTDKTGTITENKMKAEQLYIGNRRIHITGESTDMESRFLYQNKAISYEQESVKRLLTYGMVCNDASLLVKQGKYVIEGNPTDGALLIAARKYHLTEQEQAAYEVKNHLPFHSVEKQMKVTVDHPEEGIVTITKGAPEIILQACNQMMDWDGQIIPLNKKKALEAVTTMSSQALRVLAIAYEKERGDLNGRKQIIFAGLVGMYDPPRKEVKAALRECTKAGIQTM